MMNAVFKPSVLTKLMIVGPPRAAEPDAAQGHRLRLRGHRVRRPPDGVKLEAGSSRAAPSEPSPVVDLRPRLAVEPARQRRRAGPGARQVGGLPAGHEGPARRRLPRRALRPAQPRRERPQAADHLRRPWRPTTCRARSPTCAPAPTSTDRTRPARVLDGRQRVPVRDAGRAAGQGDPGHPGHPRRALQPQLRARRARQASARRCSSPSIRCTSVLRAPMMRDHDPAKPAARLGPDTIVQYVQGTGDPWGDMATPRTSWRRRPTSCR